MTPSNFNKITHWWLQAVTKKSSPSQNCWNVFVKLLPIHHLDRVPKVGWGTRVGNESSPIKSQCHWKDSWLTDDNQEDWWQNFWKYHVHASFPMQRCSIVHTCVRMSRSWRQLTLGLFSVQPFTIAGSLLVFCEENIFIWYWRSFCTIQSYKCFILLIGFWPSPIIFLAFLSLNVGFLFCF